MRIKDPKNRKTLLNISKETPKAIKELLVIRGDNYTIKEELDAFSGSDKTVKLMKKKNAALFISNTLNSSVTIGRTFNNELLEIVKLKIHKMQSSSDFSTLPPELYVKYFLIIQNIKNKKIENLFIDFLHQPSTNINISALRYAWILNQSDKIITLKFVRVLNDLSVEDIGPFFEFEIEKEFYCGDELYEKAFAYIKPKTQKNVSSNAFKDKVGKIHIDKQDLKDINLKKSRAYRSK